ncbi:hypothetical protein, variant 2 [Aphanomyces invadans]|nr:hypothetical protein, variant 2 [Aphanomyces invadans]ETV93996.1 hypothetical protein, variant 2 [Aphanomyces invadans]|eukprot:XP_008877198.1 hypothetical protein, variant 2 [Aphanomyces invadans]
MMANATQANNGAVLYVSGEESVGQVKMRADRLAHASPNLYLASETNIESIVGMVQSWDKATPCAGVMVDSIQTMYSAEINSTAGNVSQVKECTLQLLRLCKVDGVLSREAALKSRHGVGSGHPDDHHRSHHEKRRHCRPQSSRAHCGHRRSAGRRSAQSESFSPVYEKPVWNDKRGRGLVDDGCGARPAQKPLASVPKPKYQSTHHTVASSMAKTTRRVGSGPMVGVAVTIVVEGTRPIPVEIQTLSSRSFDDHRTTCTCHGVSYDKLQLIFAVLDARANVSFRSHTAFVNIAQGYFLDEPCADLALAVALASSATKRPVVPNAVFFGELALSGMLRPAVMLEPRLAAASKIGVETCVIPRVTCAEGKKVVDKYRSLVNIRQVDTLVEALAFGLLK